MANRYEPDQWPEFFLEGFIENAGMGVSPSKAVGLMSASESSALYKSAAAFTSALYKALSSSQMNSANRFGSDKFAYHVFGMFQGDGLDYSGIEWAKDLQYDSRVAKAYGSLVSKMNGLGEKLASRAAKQGSKAKGWW